MIIKPTLTELLQKVNNKFELVIMTSKRARQIASENNKESDVTLAAEEIIEGKVTKC